MRGIDLLCGLLIFLVVVAALNMSSCGGGRPSPWAAAEADSTHMTWWRDSTAECRVATNRSLGIALSCWPRRGLR